MIFTLNTSFSKTKWKVNNSVNLPNTKNNLEITNAINQQNIYNLFKNGMFNRIKIDSDCINCKIYK